MERETLNRVIAVLTHEQADARHPCNPFLDLVGSFAALGAIRETAESFRLYAPLYPRAAAEMATRAVDEIVKRYLTEHEGIDDWRIAEWRDSNPSRFEHLRASFRFADDFQSELIALAGELRSVAARAGPWP